MATNRLEEAEPLMRRALAIDEQSYGPEHPKVATDLNNLAQLLQATNRLEEAEPLMRRALAIDEQSYRPRAPQGRSSTSTTWPSCSRPPTALKRPSRYCVACSTSSRRTRDRNTPRSLLPSTTWPSCSRPPTASTEAEPLMRRALAIDEQSYGPEHPEVATRPQQPGPVAPGHEPPVKRPSR